MYRILYLKLVILTIFLINTSLSNADDYNLEEMDEKELAKLLQEESQIITLFSKNKECTGKCGELESSLVSVREDLVEETGAWVIKSFSSKYLNSFGVKDSAVIFIRSGAPLLYTGPSDDEQHLLHYFLSNKESSVHHLNDKTFEHQTQVATGATTGDWLIVFTKSECDACTAILPTVESVAANLKGRKSIAIMNREDDGAVTTRRFGVKTFPSFIFFRLGRMYRYDLPLQDVGTLQHFTEDGFRNAQKLDIPTPKSPFDDVIEAAADWLRENPSTFLMTVGGIILAVAILIALNRPPPESWAAKKKKK